MGLVLADIAMTDVAKALVVLGAAYVVSGLVFLLPNPRTGGHTENPVEFEDQ